MQRRTFIAGGAIALRALGANDRVNFAVIGVGGRGRGHLTYISKQPNARVAAVCDVNQAQTERAVAIVEKAGGDKPKVFEDLRKVFEDKDIDAVSIATPNHWHALATIWACQAGKDVYCEKPASYNIWESQRMLAAARKYKRMVQIGMQSRSTDYKMRAIELLHEGAIGKIYLAKGLCYKRRPSIGHTPDEPVPPGVNWDLFLGPAAMTPYSKNRHAYNWHWFWNTGNGDIGNQGIHEMDIARWGLGVGLPNSGFSSGGKYVYTDDQETPNTQLASLDYGDKEIVFEVRGLPTGGESGIEAMGPNFVGDVFYGEKGFMAVDHRGFKIFLGPNREPGESGQAAAGSADGTIAHFANLIDAIKSRKHEDLHGEVAIGAESAMLVHIANTSYRLGRKVKFDPSTQSFPGDNEANRMKTRNPYRAPYVVS
jgi:predicted dehydrogenase